MDKTITLAELRDWVTSIGLDAHGQTVEEILDNLSAQIDEMRDWSIAPHA